MTEQDRIWCNLAARKRGVTLLSDVRADCRDSGRSIHLVMPALVAGIHVLPRATPENVDGRDDARP